MSDPQFVVAAVVIRDDEGRILLVRKQGTSRFMLPGGKIEPGETPAECAIREAAEELGVTLDPESLDVLGDWTAPAANEPGHSVRGHMFLHPWVDGIAVHGEIADLRWFDPRTDERRDLAPLFEHRVLPALLGQASPDRPSTDEP